MMSLNDGAADGEPDTHTVAFRRVEGVKQLVHVLRIDAHAVVPDAQAHMIAVLAFGADQQAPRATVHILHRYGAVHAKFQAHLLNVDATTTRRTQLAGTFALNT